MTADNALPVWTIRPNWASGIVERLSWLTDVIPSTYGTEQTRALRLSPRREFEMSFLVMDAARSYFELFLHRLGWTEFMVPLFHDKGKVTAALAPGAAVIPVNTLFREFTVGGMAVLIGDDPFTFDKVEIIGKSPNDITVKPGGITRAWEKGCAIHPLRRTRIEQESAVAALSNRVGEATLRFQLNQANDIEDEGAWGPLYRGYPVLATPPNRREAIDLSFLRNSMVLDNDHGLTVLGDDAQRAFTVQVHNKMLRGRAEQFAFRQFLYRLRGQQGAIWLPTFNRDFRISRAKLAGTAQIDIDKIGYAYTGGAVSGRTHVFLPGGATGAISGTVAAPSSREERLVLTAPLAASLAAGSYGSFMEPCRLASDDIEITHHTDTDGTAECNLSFRAFRDERTTAGAIDMPIPAAVKSPQRCGAPAPEEAGCVDEDTTGWWLKVRMTWGWVSPNTGLVTKKPKVDISPGVALDTNGDGFEDTGGPSSYTSVRVQEGEFLRTSSTEWTWSRTQYPVDFTRHHPIQARFQIQIPIDFGVGEQPRAAYVEARRYDEPWHPVAGTDGFFGGDRSVLGQGGIFPFDFLFAI